MSHIRQMGKSKNYFITFRWRGKYFQRSLKTANKKEAENLQKEIDARIMRGKFDPKDYGFDISKKDPS